MRVEHSCLVSLAQTSLDFILMCQAVPAGSSEPWVSFHGGPNPSPDPQVTPVHMSCPAPTPAPEGPDTPVLFPLYQESEAQSPSSS